MLRGDLARPQDAQNLLGGVLNDGIKGAHPGLDRRSCPRVGDIIFQGWMWRLKHVGQHWWLWAGGSTGAAGALGAEERPASLRGVRSMPWACSFSFARAKSSEVAFKARRAEPSGAAGAWAWSCWMRREIIGAWKARAWVVLLGTSLPWEVCRASAMASRSSLLSRISWSKGVVEDRLCYAASWNQPAIFPVAEGPGGVICCAVVGQEPWVDVDCGKARNANPGLTIGRVVWCGRVGARARNWSPNAYLWDVERWLGKRQCSRRCWWSRVGWAAL